MIKWIGLITIISCLTINLITGQLPFIDQKSPNIEIQQQLTDKDQIGLKTAPSFSVNNVNGINQIKTDQLPANQQPREQQLININPVTQSSKSDSIKLQTSVQPQSNQVEIKSQSKDDGEYKTLEEILSLAGLANVDALVPSSDPKSFLIKTRTKTTEDKEEDDEKEEKEVKKTTKKKSKKKSTKKSSKKSSKKSKKKSKKKKKKKKSCGCCCCCK